jgi:hypothetical protein
MSEYVVDEVRIEQPAEDGEVEWQDKARGKASKAREETEQIQRQVRKWPRKG